MTQFSFKIGMTHLTTSKKLYLIFFSATFKDNKFLLKGLITGSLNILLTSNFLCINNIKFYTVGSSKYSNYFGFTKEEVIKLISHFNLDSNIVELEKIENWYYGYSIGDSCLFNPYSIIHFFNENFRLSNYWFNANSNEF